MARLTGGAPGNSGKDSISHILYIKNAHPEIYERTYKFLEPTDYINLRFTGRYAASFDSIALHWLTDNRKISNVAYDRRLVDISTIDQAKLPELKHAIDVLGPIRKETARELGLNEDVRVIVGTPDVQSAAVGSGAVWVVASGAASSTGGVDEGGATGMLIGRVGGSSISSLSMTDSSTLSGCEAFSDVASHIPE